MSEPPAAALPPPSADDKSGPESRRTEDKIPLRAPPEPPVLLPSADSPSSEVPLPPLLPPERPARPPPDDDPPDKLPDEPSTPLLSELTFDEIAETLGVIIPDISAWKLGIGWGFSMPNCLFFSTLLLSNWSINLVFASRNWSIFYKTQI